jgi:hypothetical protein
VKESKRMTMLNSKNAQGDLEYVNDVAKITNEYQQASAAPHADRQKIVDEATVKLTEAHRRFLDRNVG